MTPGDAFEQSEAEAELVAARVDQRRATPASKLPT
jgi:hypothetical protein